MPHPGWVSVCVGHTGYGPRYALRSLTGRQSRRKARRRARRFGQRLRAARETGGIPAFIAMAADALRLDPWERAGLGL